MALGKQAMEEDEGGGIGGSVAQGASTGSMFGPIGAGIGAAAGGIFGGLDRQSQKKKRNKMLDQTIGKHRRLAKITEVMRESQEKKLTSMAGLSQAAMDWANLVR